MVFDPDEFVDRHLRVSAENFEGCTDPEELHELCRMSIELFSNESSLVRLDYPCVIVANLYGRYIDLRRVFSSYSENGVNGAFVNNYMFIGNYVSYSSQSLETISLLLALKLTNPGSYGIVRGPAECVELNSETGFFHEFVAKFGDVEGKRLFDHFNEVFSWLPLGGLINGTNLCVGGLSPKLRCLADIEQIPRPIPDVKSNSLEFDLLSSLACSKNNFELNSHLNMLLYGRNNIAKCLKDLDIRRIFFANCLPSSDKRIEHYRRHHRNTLAFFVFTGTRVNGRNHRGATYIATRGERVEIRVLGEDDEEEDEEEEEEEEDDDGDEEEDDDDDDEDDVDEDEDENSVDDEENNEGEPEEVDPEDGLQ